MRRNLRLFKVGSLLTVASLLVGLVSPLFVASPAYAAGVATSVSPSELVAATATDVTFSYKSSAEFASGDTITLSFSPAVSAVAQCDTATVDADGDLTNDGALGSLTTSGAVYTFTAATTTASTGGVDLCLKVTAATGNYSLAFTDYKYADPTDNDFGAAMLYAGDDNDVLVTAQVQPTLAFVIRTAADDADTNVCELGVLSMATVNECSYRLKVTTNSDSGFMTQVTTDGGLRDDEVPTNVIDAVAEDSVVTAGNEEYGVEFAGGAVTGGSVTEEGDFVDDDTPLPTSATDMYSADGNNNPTATDTTNTALVTHRASVDADTATGNYYQTVTYTVTASF